MLAIRVGGVVAVAFPLAVIPSTLAGRRTKTSASATPPGGASGQAHSRLANLGLAAPVAHGLMARPVDTFPTRPRQPAPNSGGYVNPLASAHVTPERIDQGVDYSGSGTLKAIGAAKVTHVATTGTGWPGSFIEYRLLTGPDAGRYVYYAEGVTPAHGLRVGERVAAGQPIATIIPGWESGIELGWGAGTSTTTYAAKTHQWTAEKAEDNIPSAAGKSFSALIASLGGRPGRVEG